MCVYRVYVFLFVNNIVSSYSSQSLSMPLTTTVYQDKENNLDNAKESLTSRQILGKQVKSDSQARPRTILGSTNFNSKQILDKRNLIHPKQLTVLNENNLESQDEIEIVPTLDEPNLSDREADSETESEGITYSEPTTFRLEKFQDLKPYTDSLYSQDYKHIPKLDSRELKKEEEDFLLQLDQQIEEDHHKNREKLLPFPLHSQNDSKLNIYGDLNVSNQELERMIFL
ncbi:BA75_00511T0 [Komagataella pastoris]|uniref:BA75_00511T0 n=1 Tax=Komagataella pastoris TaxID=4922 RepID=A0A1B2J8G6_PICPA|nr:BA75_00511T0 [Komagataella pastoris]